MQILKILWRLFFAKRESSTVEGKAMEVKQMDVSSVSTVVAYFVFAALGWLALNNVEQMTQTLKDIEKSVSVLNANMSVVASKQVDHDGAIKDHEFRIRAIERK